MDVREGKHRARLKDLCREDKEKIGDLLHVMAAERSRSKDMQRHYDQSRLHFHAELKTLRRQNRALSQARDLLQRQLDHSLSLLRKYKITEEEPTSGEDTRRVEETAGPFTVSGGSEFGETFGTSGFRKEVERSQENSSRPSAIGEVKSLRQDLANLSMSLKQIAAPTRRPLAPLQISEANSRRDSVMSPLELKSPLPNPVVSPSTLPSSSFVLGSPRYDEEFFALLEDMETGKIAQSTPKAGFY